MVAELATRAATAIDNALLFRKIQEEDQRKNEFLAMLAHELRNPLAPISNAVHILRSANDDPVKLAWARELIARQLKQLVRLVDDLLDVSRITRGKIELKIGAVEVAQVVSAAIETSKPNRRRPAAHAVARSCLPRRCTSRRFRARLANPLEPDQQRREVHAAKAAGFAFRRPRSRRRRVSRARFGRRDSTRIHRAHLRALHAGRPYAGALAWRAGDRAHARAPVWWKCRTAASRQEAKGAIAGASSPCAFRWRS